MNRWMPQQTFLALRVVLALAVALVGADLWPADGWTWDE